MNKFKVSHEVPLCLLEQNKKWSDYDYILPHLLDKFPIYESYMRNAKLEGRYLIMDNSLHELGEPYSEDRLLHWVNELKPNEFIVPDLWENPIGTMQLAESWTKKDIPKETTKVAVVQSKSFEMARDVYIRFKTLGYKKIAFSYGASYYNKVSKHSNPYLGKALGRIQVISNLYNEGIISPTDRIHLLGCSVPQEFGWYNGMEFIETIDTSNPIMSGYDEILYDGYGLDTKPKTKIDDIIDASLEDIETKMHVIRYNLNKFKSLNNIK